jgi:hypothetical protein
MNIIVSYEILKIKDFIFSISGELLKIRKQLKIDSDSNPNQTKETGNIIEKSLETHKKMKILES